MFACPHCQTSNVTEDVRVSVTPSAGMADVAVCLHFKNKTSGWFLPNTTRVALVGAVCNTCGTTRLYVKETNKDWVK